MPRVKEPADWTKDAPEVLRERKGYWMTGFGTGPDTVMGVLWGASLLLVAGKDGMCFAFNGLSSGADGMACTDTDFWNDTFFASVNGSACFAPSLLGDDVYKHDPALPGCADAFAAYRAEPAYTGGLSFTCNCTGPRTDHTYLGSAGGLRPSGMFNLLTTISLALVGVLSPVVGTNSDYSSRSLFSWKVLCGLGALSNFGMMALAPGYIWVAGMVFAGFTVVFTEIQIPIRASYMDKVAFDNPTRGYLGAMRQFSSYTAQLIFTILMVVPILFFSAQLSGIIVAGVCAVWYGISMPLFLRLMREHPARREKPSGSNMCSLTFSQIFSMTKRLATDFPMGGLFLVAHAFAQFGGPIFVTLISTYLPAQLGVTDIIQVNVVALVVLLVGVGATLSFAYMMKKDLISFKLSWMIILTLNILIGALVPVVAKDEDFISYLLCVVLSGVLGAVAISWFYSLGWPCFCSMVPADEVAAYNGIFSFWNATVQPFATLIYFSIVQATNSHPLAWALTTTPFCAISLVIMIFVDFKKGAKDAGREAAVAVAAPVTSST